MLSGNIRGHFRHIPDCSKRGAPHRTGHLFFAAGRESRKRDSLFYCINPF